MFRENNKSVLKELLAGGEEGRLERSKDRHITEETWDGESWKGLCEVNGKLHQPRIKIYGGRSFGCNCLDHQKLRGSKGPCKHVISLAKKALKRIEKRAS